MPAPSHQFDGRHVEGCAPELEGQEPEHLSDARGGVCGCTATLQVDTAQMNVYSCMEAGQVKTLLLSAGPRLTASTCLSSQKHLYLPRGYEKGCLQVPASLPVATSSKTYHSSSFLGTPLTQA
eukprot:6181310-Pleurochrysis_carterae.AAC.2